MAYLKLHCSKTSIEKLIRIILEVNLDSLVSKLKSKILINCDSPLNYKVFGGFKIFKHITLGK